MRILKNPVKQAENTQKDQGNSQEEKDQGNKNTKEKKDREVGPKLANHFPPTLDPFRDVDKPPFVAHF